PVAGRGTRVVGLVAPRAAADHALAAVTTVLFTPGVLIGQLGRVLVVPAVLHPFPDVPGRVMEPEGMLPARELADGSDRVLRVPVAAAAFAVCQPGLQRRSPPIRSRRAAASRVFPFSLRRQTV